MRTYSKSGGIGGGGFQELPRDDQVVDEVMPPSRLQRIKVFRSDIQTCVEDAEGCKKRGTHIPLRFSLATTAGVAAVSCAVQMFVYRHQQPRPGSSKVYGMWELGLGAFGLAAVILFAWWWRDRKTFDDAMDTHVERLQKLDYVTDAEQLSD